MTDLNEKELSTWGITRGLRSGLLTSLMGLMILAIVVLFFRLESEKKSKEKLYERLINARVDKNLKEPILDLKQAINDVRKVNKKASTAADKVDSLSNQYNKNKSQ